jgi:putative peptidoglycan lipid II flippase
LRRWEDRVKSAKQKIFGAATVVGGLTIAVQLSGFGKELAVAAWFGTGDVLDAFVIALLVPSFAVNVIAGSLPASFLPTFIHVYEKQGIAGAQELLSNVLGWFTFVCFLVSVLLILLAPQYLPALCSGFSPEKLHLTKIILYFLIPIILLKGASNICAAVLNSLESFAVPAAFQIFAPLTAVVFILTAGSRFGIYALVFGTVLGFGLETLLLGAAMTRRSFSLRPRVIGLHPDMRIIFMQFLPVVAGAVIMGSSEMVDKGMAAALGSGSVASLNYGNKIIAAVLTLATTALGTAALPYFSKMVAQRDLEQIRQTVGFYLKLVFVFSVPVAIGLYVFSDSVVRLVFQRGAFTAEDVTLVGAIQAMFAFQIPFYIGGILLVRLISSLKANHILMWGAVINLGVNVGLNILFIQLMGVKGIALSTSFVYLVSFSYLFFFIRRLLRHSEQTAAES